MGYWDPPEEPELPECPLPNCDGWANETFSVVENGNTLLLSTKGDKIGLRCEDCGHLWLAVNPWPDPDPEAYQDPPGLDELLGEEDVDNGPLCPHDNPWGDCAACDHMSDMAFDAAREARLSR